MMDDKDEIIFNNWIRDNPILISKLDIMIKRCEQKHPERDSLLLVEGGEGEGKSNSSGIIGLYISRQSGRKFNNSNFFFDVKKMVEFAQSTTKQIIIWDEPALDGLSSEWWKNTQKNLIKLLV